MSKQYRNWSQEQKLAILEEAKVAGMAATCRKYNLADSMIYKWRDKLESRGQEALRSHTRASAQELRQLEDENRRLKQILADKELELQMQKELIKKKIAAQRANGKS
jgi:putative transposase